MIFFNRKVNKSEDNPEIPKLSEKEEKAIGRLGPAKIECWVGDIAIASINKKLVVYNASTDKCDFFKTLQNPDCFSVTGKGDKVVVAQYLNKGGEPVMAIQCFQLGQDMKFSKEMETYFYMNSNVFNLSNFQIDDRFYLCMEDTSSLLIDMKSKKAYHLEGNHFTYDLKDYHVVDVESIKIEENDECLEMVFSPKLDIPTIDYVNTGCFHLYVDKEEVYSYCEYDKYAKMEDFELEREDSEFDKE